MPRKAKHPLNRSEITAICKRLVKEDQYDPRRDVVLFYKIFEHAPSKDFWLLYDPGFPLNSMAFFLTEEGLTQLKTDYSVFQFNFTQSSEPVLENKIGDNLPKKRRANTVYDLLKPFNPLNHEQTK